MFAKFPSSFNDFIPLCDYKCHLEINVELWQRYLSGENSMIILLGSEIMITRTRTRQWHNLEGVEPPVNEG